jgi:hypothetical protein
MGRQGRPNSQISSPIVGYSIRVRGPLCQAPLQQASTQSIYCV